MIFIAIEICPARRQGVESALLPAGGMHDFWRRKYRQIRPKRNPSFSEKNRLRFASGTALLFRLQK
jgi:hypothetical protein